MSAKKKPTRKEEYLLRYERTMPHLPHKSTRSSSHLPHIAEHPEIFEYIGNFENNRKYLLLVSGNKKEQVDIMEYVVQEIKNRNLLELDENLALKDYILTIHKEVCCLNRDDSSLRLEIYDDVSGHKRYMESLLNDLYCSYGEELKEEDFNKYRKRILERFNDGGQKANYEIYKEISIEYPLIKYFSDRIKESHVKNEGEESISLELYTYLQLMPKCKILYLLDISSNNNEFWLGYTSEIMKKRSRFKPDLIIATLKKGEMVKKLPKPFTNLFEIISLDGEEAVVERVGGKIGSKIKLRIVRNEKKVYWEGNPLSITKDTNFNILNELAKTPGKRVKNDKLYRHIKSSPNRDVLLNQRMTNIRNTFPPPYNDIKQSQCIIPDAKRNKGYRYLNLTKEQVEIV